MGLSIDLINPRENRPSYHSMEVLAAWAGARAVSIADLSTTTVAALVPHGWDIRIFDERIQTIDWNTLAEVVGITGKVSQRDRMIEIAGEFRRRGKLVLIGGPYASLNPEDVRPHADILVVGELEHVAKELFGDLESGSWKTSYRGAKADLSTTPIPRWDLYPRSHAITGQLQSSRGCPFECEFCDVIVYLGRKQRWKEPDQVVAELDVLYARGYRSVFVADDNFTVVRRRARALLERLVEWNGERPAGRVTFSTQASIDLARDPDLLRLCAQAGFAHLFVGIETPNEDSLAETLKRQNLRIDLAGEIRKIVGAGINVMTGLIIGFDHDGPGIFEQQASFIEGLPVPLVTLGLLVAPAATPLHARLEREGRLVSHSRLGAGGILETNIRPKLMSEDELRTGMQWLLNVVYSPSSFVRRLQNFSDTFRRAGAARRRPFFTGVLVPLAQRLSERGGDERKLLAFMEQLAAQRPEMRSQLANMLIYYCQARYVLEHDGAWDPSIGARPMPFAAPASAIGIGAPRAGRITPGEPKPRSSDRALLSGVHPLQPAAGTPPG